MKLKSAIFLLIFALGGYYGYGTFMTHTSREMVAYRAFSSALMEGNPQRAARWTANEEAMQAFQYLDRRQERYRGDIRFVFHRVLRHEVNENGRVAHLRVRQIARMDRTGERATVLGGHRVDEIHHVVLHRDEDRNWRVASFSASFVGG